jgi:thiosulfate/3-mercaptopyruvate sulfurtransferase
MGPLVSVLWLRDRLGEPDIRVLDASWYIPATGRNAHAEYRAHHIPGAHFFDLDEASDPTASLPHMLPAPEHFAAYVETLGVSSGDTVVVYDASGANLSAARAWWMFRAMGHEKVMLLDGGLQAWMRASAPVASGDDVVRTVGRLFATPGAMPVASFDETRAALVQGGAQVVDMRSAGRFEGVDPEPRPGLRGGHMPGARNVPYATLVDGAGLLLPPERLESVLRERGVDPERPVIATCGSGVSACALILALASLGKGATLYDGSWSEWGHREDTPVATGPA